MLKTRYLNTFDNVEEEKVGNLTEDEPALGLGLSWRWVLAGYRTCELTVSSNKEHFSTKCVLDDLVGNTRLGRESVRL